MEYCFENNIIPCRIPSHTSHKLQPCDVGVFGPLKAAYREQVERLYWKGANTVGKQHFTSLYGRAREQALTFRNIKAGWSKTGLYPSSSDRVLKDIQKSLAELYVLKNDEVKMKSCSQGVVLQTPVTSEALTSQRSRIEHDAHLLDGPSKHRLQKLANAAQKAFAGRALLLDENRLLFEQNNESNCRQSTRLGEFMYFKTSSDKHISQTRLTRNDACFAKDFSYLTLRLKTTKTSITAVIITIAATGDRNCSVALRKIYRADS